MEFLTRPSQHQHNFKLLYFSFLYTLGQVICESYLKPIFHPIFQPVCAPFFVFIYYHDLSKLIFF